LRSSLGTSSVDIVRPLFAQAQMQIHKDPGSTV